MKHSVKSFMYTMKTTIEGKNGQNLCCNQTSAQQHKISELIVSEELDGRRHIV